LINGKLNSLGQKAESASMPVVLASDSTHATETNLTGLRGQVPTTLGQKAASASMSIIQASDADLASQTSLAAMSAKLPSALGTQTKAASLSVTLASDQTLVQAGLTVVDFVAHSCASTVVTTSTYTELIASTAAASKKISIVQTNGADLIIAVGGAGSEVDSAVLAPGGQDTPIELAIPAGSRLSVKAISVGATVGYLYVNLMG
jgi:hypothetical protein